MIIDGRQLSANILQQLDAEVKRLPFEPVFCDVLVGSDQVSASYVRIKARTAEKVGIKFRSAHFPESINSNALTSEIKKIGNEKNICGLIIQLPLPQELPRQEILDAVDPDLDVDCMTTVNTKNFYSGNLKLMPPTAAAVLHILKNLNINLKEKNFLVLGQGELVGRPVSFLLKNLGLNVETADRKTANIEELLKKSDVIISAAGSPGLVNGASIRSGAVVIDAGTSEQGAGIVGDADFESVNKVASFVTPVPGGVGPVTVAKLLENVVEVAKLKK